MLTGCSLAFEQADGGGDRQVVWHWHQHRLPIGWHVAVDACNSQLITWLTVTAAEGLSQRWTILLLWTFFHATYAFFLIFPILCPPSVSTRTLGQIFFLCCTVHSRFKIIISSEWLKHGTGFLAMLGHQTQSHLSNHLWNLTSSSYSTDCCCVCVHMLVEVCFDCILFFAL